MSDLFEKYIVPLIPKIEEFAEKVGWVLEALFDAGPLSSEFREALSTLLPPETVDAITLIISKTVEFKDILLDFVETTVIPFVKTHAEELKSALIAIGAILAAGAIVAGITAIVGLVTSLINPLGLIVVAIGVLGAAWAGNWGGIRTTLTDFWVNTAQPILQTLWTWLQTNVPIAIQTLSNFWTNTLKPAMQIVWDFISGSLFPLFQTLAEFIRAVLGVAVTVLAAIWETKLKPALQIVWSFIQANVMPILTSLANFIRDTLGPVINTVVDGPLHALKDAFAFVRNIIKEVIDWLETLITKLKEFKLPAALTKHSPSPFEAAFLDALAPIRELTGVQLPSLRMQLGSPVFGAVGGGGRSINNVSSSSAQFVQNIYTNAPSEPIISDFNHLRSLASI
jgi:phage-related protein